MNENHTELLSRLVTSRKRDGRCAYDPEAKLELVRLCLRPGVSIARTAIQFGINPNQLRTWVTRYQQQCAVAPISEKAVDVTKPDSTFVAAQIEADRTNPILADAHNTAARPPAMQTPAFLPVQVSAQKSTVAIRMQVRLPNGVEFNLDDASVDDLSPVLHMLSKLPCSGSTTR